MNQQNPYNGLSKQEKIVKSILETPSGIVSVMNFLLRNVEPPVSDLDLLVGKAIQILINNNIDKENFSDQAEIEGYLARGFESSVVSFRIGQSKWVAKVGYNRGFAVGLWSPVSTEYAATQRWNYAVLDKVFTPVLPYLLPRPYYIISPEQMGIPLTVQITPFIEKIKTVQSYQLQKEKKEFLVLSRKLQRTFGVFPDLVKSNNVIIGCSLDQEPHLKILDIGLFNLSAPTPLLNLLGLMALRYRSMKW